MPADLDRMLEGMTRAAEAIRDLGPAIVRVQMHADDIETLRTAVPTRPMPGKWPIFSGVPVAPPGFRGIARVHYSDGTTREVELAKGAIAQRDKMMVKLKRWAMEFEKAKKVI